MVKFLSSAI